MTSPTVRVRGTADPVEVTAALVALRTSATRAAAGELAAPDRYREWRAARVAALRRSPSGAAGPG